MALDLSKTLVQLDGLARRLSDRQDDWAQRLGRALDAMKGADPSQVRQKISSNVGRPYLCADLVDGLAGAYGPQAIPEDFCVASVDGSHIDVDRHLPVRCYLINIGGCLLTYGSDPGAELFSRPTLHTEDQDLYMTSSVSGSRDEVPVEGLLVGLKRSVQEVRELAQLAREAPGQLPLLALVDGSLVLWGLAGGGYQPFVREEMVSRGLIPSLDQLRELSLLRRLVVASYISLPQSREVVNLLRLYLCPNDGEECRQVCSGYRSSLAPCDMLSGIMDRHLFGELLAPGERSDLYITNSSVSRDFYGPHRVHFYYMNTGEEIARVEMPEWVAMDGGALALGHALIMDQCIRGRGYPTAISEAHEQAVLTGPDRESFNGLVADTLARNRLPVYTSEKNLSKRVRWL